eukprot:m.92206 g.92206  ORF g.92206 m.92206 type:complete len:318 (+) comp8640_c0_seq4:100-1053(+)
MAATGAASPPAALVVTPAMPRPQVHSLLAVAFWAAPGALLRVGLQQLAPYSSFALHTTLYPLLVGCLVMGCLVAVKPHLAEHPTLVKGIGTGFCGCVTTFSSWQLEASHALVAWPSSAVEGIAEQIVTAVTIVVVGLCASFAGIEAGIFLGRALGQNIRVPAAVKPLTTLSMVGCAAFCIVIAVGVTAAFEKFDRAWEAAFAPLGACLRLYLSRFNTMSWFPLGTLSANILGTILAGIVTILLLEHSADLGTTGVEALRGFIVGFLGSLTTVSTFVCETGVLSKAQPRRAIVYLASSISLAQAVLLVINGVYLWAYR